MFKLITSLCWSLSLPSNGHHRDSTVFEQTRHPELGFVFPEWVSPEVYEWLGDINLRYYNFHAHTHTMRLTRTGGPGSMSVSPQLLLGHRPFVSGCISLFLHSIFFTRPQIKPESSLTLIFTPVIDRYPESQPLQLLSILNPVLPTLTPTTASMHILTSKLHFYPILNPNPMLNVNNSLYCNPQASV